MTKRLVLILACAMNVFWAVAQDERKSTNVEINSNTPMDVEFNECKLSLTASRYGRSDISLGIDFENTTPFYILLFGHAYTEKDLKRYKIRFDKKSYGTTSKDLLLCEGHNGDEILQIGPYQNKVLTIDGINTDIDIKKCEFPLYMAKYKNNKKYLIMRRVKKILEVRFLDDKYEEIKQECNRLIKEINNSSICTNRKHPESITSQKAPYTSKIEDLKDEIALIKSTHGWRDRDEEYQKYKELIRQLDNAMYNEEDCDECRKKPKQRSSNSYQPISQSMHQCSYCNMTAAAVQGELERTYKMLDNGQITKNQAVSKIGAIYKAYTSGCPQLKQKMNNSSSTRNKVNSLYNSIINY